MRLKLDENLGTTALAHLADADCDVSTVLSQGLSSASDDRLIDVCSAEGRTLVTLDKGFSSVLRFPPERYAGIVVLRLPEPLTPQTLVEALSRFLAASVDVDLKGKLWIVDSRRIREFQTS